MLDNLDLVGLVLRTRYAPAEFKRKRFGWNLRTELWNARCVVLGTRSLTCAEYQELVRRIFESARDYHAAAIFDYIETKTLPFAVKGAYDPSGAMRFFTVYVEDPWKDQIGLGVEVTRFGQETPADVVENLMKEMRRANETSDRALATMVLTTRIAEAGHPIPSEREIRIEFGSGGAVTVPWKHTTEEVPCELTLEGFSPSHELASNPQAMYPTFQPSAQFSNARAEPGALEAARTVLGRMAVHPLYWPLQRLDGYENPHGFGRKESFFPPLGKQVWAADPSTPYQAYIYKLEESRVGFIRVADFLHAPGQADAERDAFRDLIIKMENETDALVVDQFNNPGGSLLHMYALASMLSRKDLSVPHHSVTLDRREVLDYIKLKKEMLKIKTPAQAEKYRQEHAEELGGYPFTLNEVTQFRTYADFVIDQFNKLSPDSPTVLTPPAPLMGIATLSPATCAAYSKPILVLVNELDFSGADFFPAILQDSKRATIMGVGTGGAGGYIMQMSYFNPFGISGFYITASLAIRPSGEPIENNGVSPDVPCGLSANDLQHDYEELIASVNDAVSTIVARRAQADEPPLP